VEVCPTPAWQPEVDSSRPVRRAADLTFPTVLWQDRRGMEAFICAVPRQPAENGLYVAYALWTKADSVTEFADLEVTGIPAK
jgi:hypothetical protein